MDIFRARNATFEKAYGILCAAMPASKSRAGLRPTLCKVLPGTSSTLHAHFEPEIFFIVEGAGRMTIESQTSDVQPGDVIQIPPFAQHTITATTSTDLIFLSVYTEDFEIASLPSAALVTAAPPTPNGPLHLGHISGPYLAADMMSRYLKSRSVDVHSHTGTDDHQNYVSERAQSLKIQAEDFRVQMRSRVQAGLKAMEIEFDEIIEPKSDLQYHKQIVAFAERAIEKKLIVKKTIPFPHCAQCDHALVDALISGVCPVCREGSRGGCEACGTVVPPYQLLEPSCSRCGQAAQTVPTEVYVFELSRHLASIQEGLDKLPLSPRLRELVRTIAAAENVEVLVTHPAMEGIELPGRDQNLHVWFEMAAHYEKFATSSRFWIHSFGFDNSFYYLLFIPALLKAMNAEAKLPDAVLTNEFLTLDGFKFSTSRGHAIWADEIDANPDHMRLFLSLHRPSHRESDFRLAEFRKFSVDLETQLRELHDRARLVAGEKGDVTPAVQIQIQRFTKDVESFFAPATFEPRQASRRILAFIDEILSLRIGGSSEFAMIQALAMAMQPILPITTETLGEALNART